MFDLTRSQLHGRHLIVPSNCGRDGSLVAKRIAGSLGGVAATGCHRLEIDRHVDGSYFEAIAGRVVTAYNVLAGAMNEETLVIGTPHRLTLYLGEVLNCMVLPAGILGFARSWEEAATVRWGMVGIDHARTDRLWMWLKPYSVSEVPSAYLQRMQKAEQLVLVRSTSPPEGTYLRWLHLIVSGTFERWRDHSLAERILAPIRDQLQPLSGEEAKNLGQWEWGLPDACLEAYRQAWLACGKPADRLTVVEGETVSLYKAIVPLWESFLAHLGKKPRGLTFNSYWMAHPVWEREAVLLPIHFYRADLLEATVQDLIRRYGDRLEEMHAFVNRTGGQDDVEWLKNFWTEQRWGESGKNSFSLGFDTVDGQMRDIYGDFVPPAYVQAASRQSGFVASALPFSSAMAVLQKALDRLLLLKPSRQE